MHGHSNYQPADNVDSGNDDASDNVPFDEFHRTVHGSVELALFGKGQAQIAGLVGVDNAASHVGVDAHLFTRHSVQCKTGCDFRNAFSTFCNDDELDDGDDQEDDTSYDKVASYDEL